jgi:hypothetical protein
MKRRFYRPGCHEVFAVRGHLVREPGVIALGVRAAGRVNGLPSRGRHCLLVDVDEAYYAWSKGPESRHSHEDAHLAVVMCEAHERARRQVSDHRAIARCAISSTSS